MGSAAISVSDLPSNSFMTCGKRTVFSRDSFLRRDETLPRSAEEKHKESTCNKTKNCFWHGAGKRNDVVHVHGQHGLRFLGRWRVSHAHLVV